MQDDQRGPSDRRDPARVESVLKEFFGANGGISDARKLLRSWIVLVRQRKLDPDDALRALRTLLPSRSTASASWPELDAVGAHAELIALLIDEYYQDDRGRAG